MTIQNLIMPRFLGAVLIAAALIPAASDAFDGNRGTSSAQILRIGLGAETMGAATAGATTLRQPAALWWNPAGLDGIGARAFQAEHNEWIASQRMEWIAAGTRVGSGALVLGVASLATGAQDRTRLLPTGGFAQDGEFSPGTIVAALGYANGTSGGFGYGVAVKGVREDLGGEAGTTATLDIGLRNRIDVIGLELGAVAQNIGAGTKLGSRRSRLPTTLGAGFAFDAIPRLRLLGDVRMPYDDDLIYAGGAEVRIIDALAIRAGWQSRRSGNRLGDDLAGIGAGASIAVWRGLTFDYAYNDQGVLGGSHRIALRFDVARPLRAVPRPPPVLLGIEPSSTAIVAGAAGPDGRVDLELSASGATRFDGWRVAIVDSIGNAVREWAGDGNPPVGVIWRGENSYGQPLSLGAYHAWLEVRQDGVPYSSTPRAIRIRRATPVAPPMPLKHLTVATYVVDDVYFEEDQSTLTAHSQEVLARAAAFMREHMDARTQIMGHTDSVGKAEYNMQLSYARAVAVANYLADRERLSLERLTATGFGESQPIASNRTADGRARNRRVQVLVSYLAESDSSVLERPVEFVDTDSWKAVEILNLAQEAALRFDLLRGVPIGQARVILEEDANRSVERLRNEAGPNGIDVRVVFANGGETAVEIAVLAGVPEGYNEWQRLVTARNGQLVVPEGPEKGQAIIVLTRR